MLTCKGEPSSLLREALDTPLAYTAQSLCPGLHGAMESILNMNNSANKMH